MGEEKMTEWDVVLTASLEETAVREDLPGEMLDSLQTKLGDKAWAVTLDQERGTMAAHFGISAAGGVESAMERALALFGEAGLKLAVVGVQLEKVQKLALA
jgi:hypothetical protein